MRQFADRVDAGRQLAHTLRRLAAEDVTVVGLPRGGVPVAFEVADALDAPLDVLLVRKLGVPRQPELAFGAIGEGGVLVLNDAVVRSAGLDADAITEVHTREQAELQRRVERFRRGRAPLPLADRTVVVIDDGIATGATAKAACAVARARGARRVVLAVPIGPPDVAARFICHADEVVCLKTPAGFHAVGQGYRRFPQTRDDEVVSLLDRANRREREVIRGAPT